MGAYGGPLIVAGHESSFVSVLEFQRSCTALLEALSLELKDGSMDIDNVDNADIWVDDLNAVTDKELFERALEDTLYLTYKEHNNPSLAGHSSEDQGEPLEATGATNNGQAKKSRLERAKKKPSIRKMGRPCDREARARALRLDASKERIMSRLIEERDLGRKTATTSLHSLRSKEVEGEKEIIRRLRSVGPLKFVTSIMEAPKLLTYSENAIEELSLSDVVLSIDFHNSANVKVQEFLVLGKQPLTSLRDQLYCLTDELASKANMKVPSGYFLIEDVFYNDMRDPEAVDYSEPIISWIAEREEARKRITPGKKRRTRQKVPQFKKASMADACFQDVIFKLGSKYLYCHQGDCKHALVIRDIRLLHADDAKAAAAYPLLRFLPRLRHRKCSICKIYRAKKVTYDDKLAPANPCFFCDSCYYLLHYAKGGGLLYDDFKVYDYHHE